MPRWLTWLSSSNKTLATFPLVFIAQMFNKLRKRFMAELVWAWPSRVKLNPALHYGDVRLGSERKANWGGSNSAVHSPEISRARPPEWDPCTAAPFPASSPTAIQSIERSSLFLEGKGPMSDMAKRMEDYLRISCTLGFLWFRFRPGQGDKPRVIVYIKHAFGNKMAKTNVMLLISLLNKK